MYVQIVNIDDAPLYADLGAGTQGYELQSVSRERSDETDVVYITLEVVKLPVTGGTGEEEPTDGGEDDETTEDSGPSESEGSAGII